MVLLFRNMPEKPPTFAELQRRFEENQAAQDNLRRRAASLRGMESKGGKQEGDAEKARLRLLRKNGK